MTFTNETFSQFMEESLYGEQGFYTLGGGAGRSRDYLTSPEVGDLFGRVVASYIDNWYNNLETDQPALVIDAGCGPGALAASVARSNMKNATMINYLLVDRSPVHLKTCEERLSAMTTEFTWSLHSKIPECELPTLVIANELLDNLVFNIGYADETYMTFKPDEIDSALLGMDAYAHFGVFKNIDNLSRANVPLDIGHFLIPLHTGIAQWFEELSIATSNVSSLSLLFFDYMKSVQDFEDGNWLRLYANNKRIVGIDEVLDALRAGIVGDITTDIIKEDLHVILDVEGFSRIKFENQSQWLTGQGVDAWCGESARSASSYDLLKTWVDSNSGSAREQDFTKEREILTETTGLGAFTVVTAKREI
jgi:SAM-dependent MidA family methyltransferase